MPPTPPGLPGLPFFVAHTPPKGCEEPWHSLKEHQKRVAEDAANFAHPFGGELLAEYVGLLHDLGKFDQKFQQYLWKCYLADCRQGKRPKRGSAPHKQAGALVAWNEVPLFGKKIAQILFGHHAGMVDESDTLSKSEEWQTKATDDLATMRSHAALHRLDVKPPTGKQLLDFFPAPFRDHGSAAQEMYLRFVYSCLTDADGLDTERHKSPTTAARREQERAAAPTLAALRDTLRTDQQALLDKTAAREEAGEMAEQEQRVNAVRRAVYEDCRDKGRTLPPGVFTLTVPTGGGKTRSSLAFALEHAVEHGLRRVIYAAPFTSILDQTAEQFQRIFGKDSRVVLEHHSAVEAPESGQGEEDDDRELWRRLAAENWDAPLIVTTQVQLFESLFSNRPAKCRKLHNIAGSVLVLDEVQSLPPRLLAPLISALNLLAAHFKVSIVLCTATQPALDEKTPYLSGFDTRPVEIVTDKAAHFAALRCVRYQVEPEPMDWPAVAAAMRAAARECGGCLCIVNARRSAKQLTDELDPDRKDARVFHLSTLLCGRHRRAVLEEVRGRLGRGEPTLLVATSVIEAGVDVDFPRALRALAPLPSIIQAAGRCNREGRREPEESLVTVFTPAEDVMPADTVYQQARLQTQNALARAAERGEVFPFDDPAEVTAWFRRFLHDLNNQTDAYGVMELIRERRFDKVAEAVRLIPDTTVPVFIERYADDEARNVLDSTRSEGRQLTRDDWRVLRPFLVSIFAHDAAKLGLKDDEFPSLFVWYGKYDEKAGLDLDADPGDGVVRQASAVVI